MIYFDFLYEKRCFVGALKYLSLEKSFYFDPWNSSESSIIIGKSYFGLDFFVKSGEIVQVSGLNPSSTWINKQLVIPKSKTGRVFCNTNILLPVGIGIDYRRDFETFFDKKNNYICVGDPQLDSQCACIEFCNKTYAVIKNRELLSIRAKIEIV